MNNCCHRKLSSFDDTYNPGEEKPHKIFVGGLPPETTDLELQVYFQRFGSILSCKSRRWDSDASKCKGYAVLEVADWPTYQRITAAPHFWLGRHIECKRAILKKKALLRYNKRVMSLKVFVTGLPLQTTDDDLHEYFGRFGPIEMAYVVTKYVRKTRIGYVCFRRRADKTAVLEHEGHRMRGQKIFVLDYQSKEECENNEVFAQVKSLPKQKPSRNKNTDQLHHIDFHSTDEEHPKLGSQKHETPKNTLHLHTEGPDSNLCFNIESPRMQAQRLAKQANQLQQKNFQKVSGSWPTKHDSNSSIQVTTSASGQVVWKSQPREHASAKEYPHPASGQRLASGHLKFLPLHHNPSLTDVVERSDVKQFASGPKLQGGQSSGVSGSGTSGQYSPVL